MSAKRTIYARDWIEQSEEAGLPPLAKEEEVLAENLLCLADSARPDSSFTGQLEKELAGQIQQSSRRKVPLAVRIRNAVIPALRYAAGAALLLALVLGMSWGIGRLKPQPASPLTTPVSLPITASPPPRVSPIPSSLPSVIPTAIPAPELPVLSPIQQLGKGTAGTLAVSPDGRWLAIGTPLGIYAYHADTFEQAWFLPVDASHAYMDYSPDSQVLAASMKEIVLLDAGDGKELNHLPASAFNLAWSPDGKRIVTGGSCRAVTVWDPASGEKLKELQGGMCSEGYSGVYAAWSADGSLIYGEDLAWDGQTYQPISGYRVQMPEGAMAPTILASPQKDLLAVFDLMGSAKVYILDGKTGQNLRTLDIQSSGLAWSPDGERLSTGSGAKGSIQIWNAVSGEMLQTINGYYPFSPFNGLGWLPDGETLIGPLSPDGKLNALDLKSGESIRSLDGFTSAGASTSMTWSAAGLVVSHGTDLTWWDPATWQSVGQETPGTPEAWVISWPTSGPDRFLFSTNTGSHLVGTQQDHQPLQEADNIYPFPNTWSPDGTRLAGSDRVWDTSTGQIAARLLEGDPNRARDVIAWSPDGSRLASGDSLSLEPILIWDPGTGKTLLILNMQVANLNPLLTGLAWSPNGKWLAGAGSLQHPETGESDGMLILWDAETGRQEQLLQDAMQGGRVWSISWSPDGKSLAAGLTDGRILVWDMTTCQPAAWLQGHAQAITSLAWSPDGRQLAASSLDGTVMIWDIGK